MQERLSIYICLTIKSTITLLPCNIIIVIIISYYFLELNPRLQVEVFYSLNTINIGRAFDSCRLWPLHIWQQTKISNFACSVTKFNPFNRKKVFAWWLVRDGPRLFTTRWCEVKRRKGFRVPWWVCCQYAGSSNVSTVVVKCHSHRRINMCYINLFSSIPVQKWLQILYVFYKIIINYQLIRFKNYWSYLMNRLK